MPLQLRSALLYFTPSPLLPLFRGRTPTATSVSPSHSDGGNTRKDGGCRFPNRRARRWAAVERESEFEIDRDKAREALEKLDQQLKALSEKETALPKRRALSSSSSSYSGLDAERNQMIGTRTEEMPEISGSYLAYSAVALLILTIVNNILFSVFIKAPVDGEEPAPTIVRESPGGVTEQQAPSLSGQ